MTDAIEIEILAGGVGQTTVGALSPAHHVDAARFLAAIERLLGGTTTRRRHPNAPPLAADVKAVLVRALAASLVADYRRQTGESLDQN